MDDSIVTITAEIVSAYVSNNTVASADLPALIDQVHASLQRVSTGASDPVPVQVPLVPVVPIRKSVTPDFIICLEDGKKLKTLKRHLGAVYGLTPAAYREKWGLPEDYPMVAPNYAAKRSALAKTMGLGKKMSGRIARKAK